MSKKEVKFMAEDKSAKNVKGKMDSLHADSMPAQTQVSGKDERKDKDLTTPRQAGVMDEQFPTDSLTAEDPRDKLMAAKLSMVDDQGRTPFGQLIASDSDFDWLDRKRQTEEEANFQAWFAQNYDYMAPEQKAVAKRLWPTFYEQRQRTLESNVRLQQKIAELKLHGPQSKEDLMLQYALESGYIAADPLENILHPERMLAGKEKAKRQSQYVRGLLNPKARNTRSGYPPSRAVNATSLTGFTSTNVPGHPAWSGTRTGDGTKRGFSASEYPLTDASAKSPGVWSGHVEGGLYGKSALPGFDRNAATTPAFPAAPVGGAL